MTQSVNSIANVLFYFVGNFLCFISDFLMRLDDGFASFGTRHIADRSADKAADSRANRT